MDANLDAIRLNFSPGSLVALNVILGVLMFGVALDIKIDDFRRIVRDPRGPVVGMIGQFLILPAATFLLTLLLRPPPSVALGMILVAACPGGNVSNFMTWYAKGNTALSVTMTAMSTAAAVVMTPLNLQLWGSLNPHTAPILHAIKLDPAEVFVAVLLILGVPLVLGMSIGGRFPALVQRVRKPVQIFGIVVFLLFVLLAIRANAEHFQLLLLPAFGLVVLHNATALSSGYAVAKLLKLPVVDRRAISIEVGIQNSALGLALIFNFFGGLGGMAVIAAFWGIWHIVSGLTIATVWSRRPPPVVYPATPAPPQVSTQ